MSIGDSLSDRISCVLRSTKCVRSQNERCVSAAAAKFTEIILMLLNRLTSWHLSAAVNTFLNND